MSRLSVVLLAVFAVTVSAQPHPIFHRCNWCGIGASCIDNSFCRCPPGTLGNPYLYCYRPNLLDVCQLCDDPVVTTEDGQNVAVAYYNSTFLVDKNMQRGPINARVRVIESRKRLKGKSRPDCIRLRVDINRPLRCSFEIKVFAAATTIGDMEWRIETGIAEQGGEDVQIDRNPWRILTDEDRGEPVSFSPCGCLNRFTVTEGKILGIESTCINHVIGIRPFVNQTDWLKSGYFIFSPNTDPIVLPDGPLPPAFPLCLRRGISVPEVADRLGFDDSRHAMSFIALTNLPDFAIGDSRVQKDMRDALLRCSPAERQNLFNEADFIVNSAKFIREISRETMGYTDMMVMLRQAAEFFCEGNGSSCGDIIQTIRSRASNLLSQPSEHPKLAAFVSNNCGSPAP